MKIFIRNLLSKTIDTSKKRLFNNKKLQKLKKFFFIIDKTLFL